MPTHTVIGNVVANAPAIITAAASSPLGLVALMVVVDGALG